MNTLQSMGRGTRIVHWAWTSKDCTVGMGKGKKYGTVGMGKGKDQGCAGHFSAGRGGARVKICWAGLGGGGVGQD